MDARTPRFTFHRTEIIAQTLKNNMVSTFPLYNTVFQKQCNIQYLGGAKVALPPKYVLRGDFGDRDAAFVDAERKFPEDPLPDLELTFEVGGPRIVVGRGKRQRKRHGLRTLFTKSITPRILGGCRAQKVGSAL
jgi:hypothetical protein